MIQISQFDILTTFTTKWKLVFSVWRFLSNAKSCIHIVPNCSGKAVSTTRTSIMFANIIAVINCLVQLWSEQAHGPVLLMTCSKYLET